MKTINSILTDYGYLPHYNSYLTVKNSIGVTTCVSIYGEIHNHLSQLYILWSDISCEMENYFGGEN
jgi:hypothetical protein